MQYDPIKRSLGNVFNKTPFLRILFYKLLDLLLLRAWHAHRELRKWKKTAQRHLDILDAGAGFGQYTYWMARQFKNSNILALDVKAEQVRDCNEFFRKVGQHHVEFQEADLVSFRQENAFDLILCVDVMEHIEKDVEVFKHYHTSLKEGGMVLISTPSDQGGSDVHDDDEESFIDEHVRDGYNIQEIEDKMRSAGFEKVETAYSYGTPGKISWRLSMKYPMLMLNTSRLFFILLPFYYLLTYPVAFLLNAMDVRQKHPTGTGLIVKAWK